MGHIHEKPHYASCGGSIKPVETVDTRNYLAWCIAHIEKSGYCGNRSSIENIKFAAWADAANGLASVEHLAQAQAIIDYYLAAENEDLCEFDCNLKTVLSNQCLKPNGFIAYAPLAVRRSRTGLKN